jgi:hypothetical protein
MRNFGNSCDYKDDKKTAHAGLWAHLMFRDVRASSFQAARAR